MTKYSHAKNFTNPQTRSWGKCITDIQTDGQMDKTDFMTPTTKLEVQSCFSETQEQDLEIIQEKGIKST